jgi:hypothetical protein
VASALEEVAWKIQRKSPDCDFILFDGLHLEGAKWNHQENVL